MSAKKAEKVEELKVEELKEIPGEKLELSGGPVLKEELEQPKEEEKKEELPVQEPTGTVPTQELNTTSTIEALSEEVREALGNRQLSDIPHTDHFWELNRRLEKLIKGDN